MAEEAVRYLETFPIKVARFFDKHLSTRLIGGSILLVLAAGLVFSIYIQVTGDTSVLVKDTKGDVHITIPKAPNAGVTSRDIACKGTVSGPLSARMNGYRATYAVRDKDGIVTTYSMVLTLDDRGEPRDAYSLAWEYGDGKVDARDQIMPRFIVTETETTQCLFARAT